MRHSAGWRTFALLPLCLVLAPLSAGGQTPYEPRRPDPLLQPWRWRSFPEARDAALTSLATGPGPTVWLGSRDGVFRYDGRRWRRFGPSDGLDGSPVLSVLAPTDGPVLAGTEGGLFRLEEDRWRRAWPEGEHRVPVMDVERAPDGALWLGTRWGVVHLRASGGPGTLLTSPGAANAVRDSLPAVRIRTLPQTALPAWARRRSDGDGAEPGLPLRVRDVLREPGGTLWAAMARGELLRGTHPATDSSAWSALPGAGGHQGAVNPHLALGHDGSVWMATTSALEGIHRYQHGRLETFDLVALGGNHRNHSVLVTGDGAVWVGGLGALHRFQDGAWSIYQPPEVAVPTARTVLAQDAGGALWVGGIGQGVQRVDYTSERWSELRGLLVQTPRTPSEDAWFVSDDGGVIRRGADGGWVRWGPDDGLMDTPMAVHPASDGTIWAAGSHDGVAATARLLDGGWSRTLHPTLSWAVDYRSVYEAGDGTMWFGGAVDRVPEAGQRGGLLRFADGAWSREEPPGSLEGIYGIAGTPDGRLWTGGYQGLYRRDEAGWRRVLEPPALAGSSVDALHVDAEGVLWVGTRSSGLFRRDRDGWTRFTTADGLAADAILAVEDVGGGVWVATEGGLSRYDGRSWLSRTFTEGLPASRRMVIRGGRGPLPWIGVMTPDRTGALRVNRLEPPVRAATVLVRPDSLSPETVIEPVPRPLSPPGNVVVEWRGADPWAITPLERLEFSYSLDGGAWSPFGRATRLPLLELGSGPHSLRVRARDLDMNVEAHPASVDFSVQEPVWGRLWFQGLIAVLLAGIGAQTYRAMTRGRALRGANARLEERVRDRTRALEEANRTLQEEMKERERLEDQLIQAQKMEAVGRLAGGIAHDFNNLLTAINGYTTLVRGELPPDHPTQPDLEEVSQASERARDLVRQLLTFSRKQLVEPEVVDLNSRIREVATMLERLLGDGVRLSLELADESLRIRIDPTRLEQVVVNLVVNARDAVGGSGEVGLATRGIVVEDARSLEPEARPGPHAVMTVWDTGPGVPAQHRDQLFEPFFSTKEGGSGLGLATAYGIVTQAGGFIRVESEEGEGARFSVYLPEHGG